MKTQQIKFKINGETVKQIELPISRNMEVREQNQLTIAFVEEKVKQMYNVDSLEICFVMTERDMRG